MLKIKEEEGIEKDIYAKLESALAAAKNERLKESILAYKMAKNMILRMERPPSDALVKEVRSTHKTIAERLVKMKESQQNGAPKNIDSEKYDKKPPEKANMRRSKDDELILQMEIEKRRIERALHDNDMKTAILQYRKIRLLIQQLSEEKREIAAKKANRIFEIINDLKNHPGTTERRLVRRVP
jgi:hypothetical protein